MSEEEPAGAGPETPASGEPGGSEAPEAGAPAEDGPETSEDSPLRAFAAEVKRRPAAALFVVGLVLFLGGLFSVVGSQIGRAGVDVPEPAPTVPTGSARVGPQFGEAVEPYIAQKRSALAERARTGAAVPTLGLVVFNEYLTAGAVEGLLGSRKVEPLTAQVRIPVPGFKPQAVPLESASLADAASSMRTEVADGLARLEALAAAARDPDFKAAYEKDLQLYREAAGRLTTDPATLFAVVVRGHHSDLAALARDPKVRFVDLPADPTATLEDTTFAAVIPEDAGTATFGVR